MNKSIARLNRGDLKPAERIDGNEDMIPLFYLFTLGVLKTMVQSTLRGIRIATILLVCYWVVLFVLTHIPQVPMPKIKNSDKFMHLGAFAVLSFLLAWAIPTRVQYPYAHTIWALLLAIAYGAFDEFTQIPVGRTADIWDWVADSSGAVVGVIIYLISRKLLIKYYKFRQVRRPMTLSTPPV